MKTGPDNQLQIGGNLADVLMFGTAAGAGGMGLWHMLKNMKAKREKERAQQADFQGIANTPSPLLTAKQSLDLSSAPIAASGLGGAGLGALIGALRAEKGKRLSGALTGAGVGGGLGLAGSTLMSTPGREALGRMMGASPEGSNTSHTGFLNRTMNMLALPVGGGLAAAGGAAAVNSLLQDDKVNDNKDKVQKSRDDYFKTLLNQDDEKTAFETALDSVYETCEKQAEGNWGEWALNRIRDIPGMFNADNAQGAASYGMMVPALAALTAGGVGAAHMYNKTKSNSQAKLYAAAQKARERLRGLDSPWVDPAELAQVKHLTSQGGLPNAIGR